MEEETFFHQQKEEQAMYNKLSTAFLAAVATIAIFGVLAGCPPNAYHVLTLSVIPAGAGTITADPDQTTYFAGTEVTLEAIPNDGYSFLRWIGAGINQTANPTKKAVYADETIVAEFEEETEEGEGEGEGEGEEETVNYVVDGDFESEDPAANWSAVSATAQTILCEVGSCVFENGLGSSEGTGWARFANGGGIAFEAATLFQQLVMPDSGNATLSFDLAMPKTGMSFTFSVVIDGSTIWTYTDADATNFQTYQNESFDISDFADGRTSALTFYFLATGTTTQQSVIFLDNIAIR